MISIKVQGMDRLAAQLLGVEKQQRFATVVATTRTAQLVQAEVVEEMKRKFDRPARITLKSIFVKPATKQAMYAMVYLKDKPLGRGREGASNGMSMRDIIGHQFSGGGRNATNFERLLRSRRYLGSDEFIVPGAAARLNAYGNISSGQYVQMLSQLRITRAGSDSAPTGSKRSKRNVQKAGEMFWSFGVGSLPARAHTGKLKFDYSDGTFLGSRQHLPKGVWVRTATGVSPVVLAIKAPRYSRRIFLDVIAQKVVDARFKGEFDKAFAQAMRTAK